jgi:crossover junction endodeoxyribonuclease RuvC
MGVTPRQFLLMQQRLAGNRRAVEPDASEGNHRAAATPGVVLGIDPSLRATGYGVVHTSRAATSARAYGTIACPRAWARSRCLVQIADQLRQVIREQQPTECVVEGLFYAQNLRTALIMGEARGVCLLAAAEAGLAIYELAPRKVKQAVVGFGGAQKLAVAKMVQRMLRMETTPEPDAADALALALAHVQRSVSARLAPARHL